jgi:hypothetical protein
MMRRAFEVRTNFSRAGTHRRDRGKERPCAPARGLLKLRAQGLQ